MRVSPSTRPEWEDTADAFPGLSGYEQSYAYGNAYPPYDTVRRTWRPPPEMANEEDDARGEAFLDSRAAPYVVPHDEGKLEVSNKSAHDEAPLEEETGSTRGGTAVLGGYGAGSQIDTAAGLRAFDARYHRMRYGSCEYDLRYGSCGSYDVPRDDADWQESALLERERTQRDAERTTRHARGSGAPGDAYDQPDGGRHGCYGRFDERSSGGGGVGSRVGGGGARTPPAPSRTAQSPPSYGTRQPPSRSSLQPAGGSVTSTSRAAAGSSGATGGPRSASSLRPGAALRQPPACGARGDRSW